MSDSSDKASLATRDAALEWAARLNAPDLSPADKADFAAWLRASPIHVREYLAAEALRFAVGYAVQGDPTDARQLLRGPLLNVIELEARDGSAAPKQVRRPEGRHLRRPITFAAAVLSIACVSAVWLRYGPPGQDTYATTVGEIRRLVLPDGSVVELNTRSKIRIDFDARRRDVHLDRGEAFFTVARDAARPFRVSSHAAQIRAIGTRFSVYRQPSRTLVTVLEGIVAVQPETSPAQGAIELTAGHQVSVEADPDHASAGARAVPVDAARATSWRQHRLIFDNQPLSAVVAEFNRYNRQQLVLEDAALAAEGISGVFDSDKPQALVLFLTGNGSARATRLSDTRILLTQPEREIP